MFSIIGLGASLASFFTTAQECLQSFGGAIMRPDKETPQPGKAWGDGQNRRDDTSKYAKPASTWWGRQACTCQGEGRCLCCRRFDRAISAHMARVGR